MSRLNKARQNFASGMLAGWLALFATLLYGAPAFSDDLINSAHAVGTNPSGATISSNVDAVNLPVVIASPSISVVKTVVANDENNDGYGQINETLTYSFRVENTGNVTLTNVSITDPTATVSGGPIASLAPGAIDTATFTATYSLVAADISAGQHNNQAEAFATSIVAGSPVDGVTDLSDPSDPNGDAPTIITFTDAPIDAVDDTGNAPNGASGGTAIANVLVANNN